MKDILQVEALEIRYHTREGVLTAVRDASFNVGVGEIVGIVGESGCGKSTIASAVLRLLPPNGQITAGSINLNGQDLCQLDAENLRRIRGREIAMIFQDAMASLNPVFTVEEQMLDSLRAHLPAGRSSDKHTLRQQAIEALERVGIPDAAKQVKAYPHQFSGGMRQRISIAIALLSSPALLVADEPTSALDVTLEAQIIDLIRGLRDELSTAILYITHDLGVVAGLCDRVIVMYAGNIVEMGDVFDIFAKPKHPYTQALLRSHPAQHQRAARLQTIPGRVPSLSELPPGCKFADRCELAREVCHLHEPPALEVDGQFVLCHAYKPEWPGRRQIQFEAPQPEEEPFSTPLAEEKSGSVMVETHQLRTYFRDHVSFLGKALGQKGSVVRAVDGIDLRIQLGETLALVGESGSGKTTLGRTILRLEDPTYGEIFLEGQEITRIRQSKVRPMRRDMQMIFQDPAASLSPRKNVAELLLEPFKIHGIQVDGPSKVEELLEMVGLSSEQAEKYPHQLSGGQARRVGIARALALQPSILVADEPTAGLDVSVAAGILNLLKDLRERLNLTYIIITHNLNEILFIADRVAVMYLGRVVELADTAELFERPKHPYTEALVSAISLPDPRLRENQKRIILHGEIPSPRNPPPGCPFHPRCRYAEARCADQIPALETINGEDRVVACYFPEKVQPETLATYLEK